MVECINMFALNCILVLDFILSYAPLPYPTLSYPSDCMAVFP